MNEILISIIVPIRNEELHIKKFLENLQTIVGNRNDIEIFLVDGLSNDKTLAKINNFLLVTNLNLKVLKNPFKITPNAMNIGVNHSQGKYMLRLDAHSEYPFNYIDKLLYWKNKLKADNVGGVIKTLPFDNSSKSRSIALATSSIFGMGNSYFRIGIKSPKEVDTVPYGFYSMSKIKEIGLYDEDLVRNQDDELNARLIKQGGKIFLVPQISIKNYTRSKYSQLYKMFFQYGYFKPIVNLKLRTITSFRQLVPLLFVLFIFLGLILTIIFPGLLTLYMASLIFYAIISCFISLRIAKNDFIHTMVSFFIIHFSYGFGYLFGIISLVFKSKSLGKNFSISR
jgi:glycosyltransferase involved in cell wall biosynthesis